MEPDASTASAATSTSASSAAKPTRALTTPLPWLSVSPLHETQRRNPRKSLFTSPPPGIQKLIPESSKSQQNPSRQLFKPVVSSGRGFKPMAEPPFRIREPVPKFSNSQPDPPGKLVKPVVSSGRGFKPIAEPPFRIPEFSMSQPDPSRKLVKPVVSSGQGFEPIAEPPFRIREPIPEFFKSQPDPSGIFFNPVISSGRGFMHIGPPAPRIRDHRPEISTSQKDQPQKISCPVDSSGRGFMRKCTGSVTTDQTVTVANLGRHEAEPVVRSPRDVRPPPLDYLRPSVHKTSAPTSLHQLQHKSPLESSRFSSDKGVSPSASPKIVPPSSSAECSDSKEKGERTNVETFAVVRDRIVRITEGDSLYKLCRSWLRNGLPEKDYHVDIFLPHEDYQITLPKPLPRDVAAATRPEKKDDNKDENENENEQEEESLDHLTTEDLLREHVMRGKKVRARLREERLERISRYKHRLTLLLPKLDEPSDSDKK